MYVVLLVGMFFMMKLYCFVLSMSLWCVLMLIKPITERLRHIISGINGAFVFGPGISVSAYGVSLVEPYIEVIVPEDLQYRLSFVDYVYVCEDFDVFKRAKLFDIGGIIVPVLSLEDLIVWILKENSGLDNPLNARIRLVLSIPTLLLLNANILDIDLLVKIARKYDVYQELGFMCDIALTLKENDSIRNLRDELYKLERKEKTFLFIDRLSEPDPIDELARRWSIRTSLAFDDFKEFFIVYGRKILSIDEIRKLVDPSIDRTGIMKLLRDMLEADVSLVVLAGSALVLWGLKETTEDIDVFLKSESDFRKVEKILLDKLGLIEYYRGDVLRRFTNSHNVDIFVGDLIELVFSRFMEKRCRRLIISGKEVLIMHPQDVLLLKSVVLLRERFRKDMRDIKRIIESGLVDWKLFLQEIKYQKNAIHHTPGRLSRIRYSLEIAGAPKNIIKEIEKIEENTI